MNRKQRRFEKRHKFVKAKSIQYPFSYYICSKCGANRIEYKCDTYFCEHHIIKSVLL